MHPKGVEPPTPTMGPVRIDDQRSQGRSQGRS